MLTATVLTLHATAAAEDVTLVTLAALSARMGAVQRGGEVRAGGGAGARTHLVMAELRT